ncbi:MAG: hypothetical protein FWE98_02015 [Oscillospiraceae bacterium]|nr:hypothetical protein [Oscillospiraceae bacterium]
MKEKTSNAIDKASLPLFLVMGIVFSLTLPKWIIEDSVNDVSMWITLAKIFGLLVGMVVLCSVVVLWAQKNREKSEDIAVDATRNKLLESLNELESKKTQEKQEIDALKQQIQDLDLQRLQMKNLRGAKAYFRISKWHANLSFAFSSLACIGGLVAIGYGIWAATKKDTDAVIIATVGSAVSAFITATFFWMHRKSTTQLNRYYDSLHEVEVFLSTVDIIRRISTIEKQDEAYAKVIDELFNIQKIKAAKPAKHDKPNDKEG